MKKCWKCGIEKALTEFSRNNGTADGYLNSCKACARAIRHAKIVERDKNGRTCRDEHCAQSNPQPLSEFSKNGWVCRTCRERNLRTANENWRVAHPGDSAARAKAWREDRKTAGLRVRPENSNEKDRARAHERYANDPAYRQRRVVAARNWRRNNPEKVKQLAGSWRRNNLEEARRRAREYGRVYPTPDTHAAWSKAQREKHRESRSASESRRRAILAGRPGGYTAAYLKWLFQWQDFCCFYCHAPFDGNRTIDHTVAISNEHGGSNHPYNIVLACRGCNYAKQARLFHIEWNPQSIIPSGNFHSVYGMTMIAQALERNDIDFIPCDNYLKVGETEVFMLSSFWLGWQGDAYIKQMRMTYPNALFVFDYDWRNRPDAIMNVLRAKAGLYRSIGARKLDLISPSIDDVREFMNQYHVQGFSAGNVYLGLADMGEVYAMASFRTKDDHSELSRMAFKGHVSGGLSRIVKAFWKTNNRPLLSYCDPRWGAGNGYLKAGFTSEGETKMAAYSYANGTGLYHRLAFRKDMMAKNCDFFDENLSEADNAKANGLLRIDGLPQKRFIFK